MKPGSKPSSGTAMTHAERQARYRAKQAAGAPTFRYRKPLDRRSRLQRWRDVVAKLQDLQDEYQAWLDALPQNMADSATADGQGLATICDLDLSELEGIVPPRGLAATELLHNVKPDQIVAGLANDEATLVIINSRMG
jgi:hypothetical protein